MSGIEAAGLALAILPLIVSAAEHYEDCFHPFLQYKNFAREADFFRKLFGVQKVIFKNQCGILLQELVDHDAALAVLNGAHHLSHVSDELERRLDELLGESKEPCVSIIETIHDKLSDIESESQQLGATIEQERQVSSATMIFSLLSLLAKLFKKDTQSVGNKAWRSRVAKKLRFCFGSSSRLDQNLAALRSLNDDFVVLSQQITKSAVSQKQASKTLAEASFMEVKRYQTIRQASCQVYEALSKACTKHTEHHAQFCVEVQQEVAKGSHGSQLKFMMAFSPLNLVGSLQQDDRLWFVVNSIIGDNATDPKCETTENEHKIGLAQSLKRQIEPSQVAFTKKQKKSVRFHTSTPAPSLTAIPVPSSSTSFDSMRKDLCDYLRRCVRRPTHEGLCACLLENSGSCKNILYPLSTATCSQRRQATSLGQLISSVTEQGYNSKIPLFERVRLAKNLAIAVLQYHATPWLATAWRSEDVYFFGLESSSSMQTAPSLSSPHLNVKIRESDEQSSRASAFPPHEVARNALLFSLAVVLLEIAHSARLETMYRPVDHMSGQENSYTRFFAARRLAKFEYSTLGPRYHNVVERLVECDFGCGDDLANRQLQAAIHDEVVCPLEQLEQGLRKLYLGT